ncbi:hypothetical protein ACTID9_11870 [Brevibacillus fluminis]|uniref:hypothetical protein n=1 Tax=Brevibacillus fluminis TaxID=511487 RepID=UPI003F88E20C
MKRKVVLLLQQSESGTVEARHALLMKRPLEKPPERHSWLRRERRVCPLQQSSGFVKRTAWEIHADS